MSIATVTVVLDLDDRTVAASTEYVTIHQGLVHLDGDDVLHAIGRAVVLASGQYEEI